MHFMCANYDAQRMQFFEQINLLFNENHSLIIPKKHLLWPDQLK